MKVYLKFMYYDNEEYEVSTLDGIVKFWIDLLEYAKDYPEGEISIRVKT